MLKKVFPQPGVNSDSCIVCLQIETSDEPFRKEGHCPTCKGGNNIIHKTCYKQYIKHKDYAKTCPTCKTDKTKKNGKRKGGSVVVPMPSTAIPVQTSYRYNNLNKCRECVCLSLTVGFMCTVLFAFCAYILLICPGYMLIYALNEISFIDIPIEFNNPFTWLFSFVLSIVTDVFIAGCIVTISNIKECCRKINAQNN